MNKALIDECFGWNPRTWSKPFNSYLALYEPRLSASKTALEVGAGRFSCMSPYLSTLCSDVVCSYYDESQREAVISRCEAISKKFDLQHSIEFEQVNIFEHTKKYDVVIMKSVLGGLCRTDTGIDHMAVIRSICEKNLNDNGILITVDNGVSVFERWVSRFGARKHKWRFFQAEEFVDYDYQTTSGLLGFFSLKTRFGKPGSVVETMVFYVDNVLQKFTQSNPVVILNTYSKKHTSSSLSGDSAAPLMDAEELTH